MDYFKVCADEIRTHKICSISSKSHEDVTLFTESGYLMLVKSFTDDLAWQVQRQLVKVYFKAKELISAEHPAKHMPFPLHTSPNMQESTMPTQFDFTGLSESSPLIKSIRAGLVKGSGQNVPYVVVQKVKRVTGVSVKDVDMTLENGQTVTFRIKNTGDIYRVQLNGKDLPLVGDMTMVTDVTKEIGGKVRTGQAAFDKKQAAARVVIPKAAVSNKVQTTAQKLKAAQDQETKLDDAIAQATTVRDDLKAKVAAHANSGLPA